MVFVTPYLAWKRDFACLAGSDRSTNSWMQSRHCLVSGWQWAAAMVCLGVGGGGLRGDDWPQFRGVAGQGQSGAVGLPVTWGETENMFWKVRLPGPGTSSPVVWKDRIFLTCQTGAEGGSLDGLKRHVLCFDLKDGRQVWDVAVAAELPEQEKIREDHGYASSTLAVDADRVYAFFGRTGVLAFDHGGKELWKTSVGTGLNGWGSASSPIRHGDLLIVNASVESESVVGLDAATGKEVWRARDVPESWHTPVVADWGGRQEMVIGMPNKIKGFDPKTGAELWQCASGIAWYMCPTPVVQEGVVALIGGRGGNGLAIRLGGRGDVTNTHLAFTLSRGSNVSSPIWHDGHLYFANDSQGSLYCADATTGKILYDERVRPGLEQVYASPVVADGKLYYIGRGGRAAVVAANPTFEVLGTASLENGRGQFNASPAVAGDRLLLRSNTTLYCLKTEK
jgi:outer membrane protein assembly factor BamB